METIKISVNVSRGVALANSQVQYGTVEYSPTADDLATLTDAQRATFARVLAGAYGALIESTVAPVTWAEIVRTLDGVDAAEVEVAEVCSRFAAAVEAAIANPEPTALLMCHSGGEWSAVEYGPGGAYTEFGAQEIRHPLGVNCNSKGRYVYVYRSDVYRAALGRLEKEAARRAEIANAEWHARMHAASPRELSQLSWEEARNLSADDTKRLAAYRAAQRAQQEEANEAAIEAALQSAPAHVLGRWRDGRLPEAELKRALCDVAFAEIGLPPYVKIDDSELEHSDDCDEPDARVSSEEYGGELDAEEWESWTAAKTAIEAAGFEPELRQVRMYCANDGCDNVVTKLQARASTEIGGVSLVRGYAIG
jgi:hypothetical protein